MLKFTLAEQADESDLRELLGSSPMTGPLEIAFGCEPDVFNALQVQGRYVETIAVRDKATDWLVGMGTRAIKTGYINGAAAPIGYLSHLRSRPAYRGGSGLVRGYRFLRKLHTDGRAKLYLSTIIEANTDARHLLTSARCGLPAYHDMGRFCTRAVSLKPRPATSTKPTGHVRRARPEDIPAINRFLSWEGPQKQFFPEYHPQELTGASGLLYGLRSEGFFLAFSSTELIGTAAVWDQRRFKQNVISGYHPALKSFRPLINVGARLLGFPQLPQLNTILNCAHLGLVCVKDNDPAIFRSLLNVICKHCRDPYEFMVAGFHEKDPLLSVLTRQKGISYFSRIYVVCWSDGEEAFAQLDDRIPYLEVGAL